MIAYNTLCVYSLPVLLIGELGLLSGCTEAMSLGLDLRENGLQWPEVDAKDFCI